MDEVIVLALLFGWIAIRTGCYASAAGADRHAFHVAGFAAGQTFGAAYPLVSGPLGQFDVTWITHQISKRAARNGLLSVEGVIRPLRRYGPPVPVRPAPERSPCPRESCGGYSSH